jgi:hypothetical protein
VRITEETAGRRIDFKFSEIVDLIEKTIHDETDSEKLLVIAGFLWKLGPIASERAHYLRDG